jgi:hypothetical protein
MNKKEYKKYLKLDHWKGLSRRIRQERGNCQECGKKYNLNVHHLNYDRIGNELESDLIVLCKWCHNLRHCKIKKITKIKTLKVPNLRKGEVKWMPRLWCGMKRSGV